MDGQNNRTVMDQKIFELGLSVNTVSVYLLMTGLADSGTELTLDTLVSMYTGNRADLDKALNELSERSIIILNANGMGAYRVEPSENWK
jgi:hypothetical protein